MAGNLWPAVVLGVAGVAGIVAIHLWGPADNASAMNGVLGLLGPMLAALLAYGKASEAATGVAAMTQQLNGHLAGERQRTYAAGLVEGQRQEAAAPGVPPRPPSGAPGFDRRRIDQWGPR